ncbi:riboflavin biosynthesis protein RibF [Bacteroidales bacterium OttesenSCG-928-A17]|nr:riboflavin biosynthesis protein RibF [Bacteroidales bacterium OttesenSCG-928-A17]
MEIISLPSVPTSTSGICATIGFFDGVHRGHQFLLAELRKIAEEKQEKSAVITFRNHPRTRLQTDFIPKLLTSTEEKLELIEENGVDYCILLDFTPEIAQMTAEEFIREILSTQLNVKTLLIGYDHRFGKDRSEGFDDYVRFGQSCGMDVVQASAFEECHISSTVIRNKILHQEIREAGFLLGHLYCLTGKVIHGNRLGRKIGFPTANLNIYEPGKIIPPEGIYAVWTLVGGKDIYPGMAYIGKRPTVSNQMEERIEVHLMGFAGNLYGRTIRIEFLEYMRGDQKFDSLEELQKQLYKDQERALLILIP